MICFFFLQDIWRLTGSGDKETEDVDTVEVRSGRNFGLIGLSTGGP